MRAKLQTFFTSKFYHLSISAIILINCIVLGAETTHFGKGEYKSALKFIDFVFIIGFVVLNVVVGIIVESINEIKEQRERR